MIRPFETQQILVNRNNLLCDIFPYYASDDIINLTTYVKFVGEPAEDMTGVTKDLFSSVWKEMKAKHMKGDTFQRFNIMPRNLLSLSEIKAIGRILEHGHKKVNLSG